MVLKCCFPLDRQRPKPYNNAWEMDPMMLPTLPPSSRLHYKYMSCPINSMQSSSTPKPNWSILCLNSNSYDFSKLPFKQDRRGIGCPRLIGGRHHRRCRRQLQQRLRHHVGWRPRKDTQRRPAPDVVPGQDVGVGLPIQEAILVWQDRHAAQTRAWELRRHRHRLLRKSTNLVPLDFAKSCLF